MKLKALFLALAMLGTASFSASASPVRLQGQKGVYTVDFEAGTYYGCVQGNGCISLDPSQRIGPQSWQNGDYVYKFVEEGLVVYQNGTLIFSDYIAR